jgi:molecular chaperone Hsp33
VPLVEKYPGKLDVGATVGTDGTLTVIRDLQMKEPYIGSTPLISGEIGDDVTAYFAQSEQTPTACALGVLVDRDRSVKVAGGYLVQLLPGAPDDVIDKLEAGIRRAGAVTPMLEAGMTPEDILGQVCGDLGVLFMGTQEVSYKCYCSRERMEAALISLGRKELSEIAADGEPLNMTCQFCDTVHTFTPDDIQKLLKTI